MDNARLLSESATDYLERPFSNPMLRSRVRAWVARTATAPIHEITAPPIRADETVRGAESRPEPGGSDSDTLAQSKLFRDLDPEHIADLVSNASEQIFPAGYPILREGEPVTSVYVIMSGRVRVMESVPDGPADMFLGELSAGESFGEIGFLRDSPRSATVATLVRTRCLVIPQNDFVESLEASPALCMSLLRVLATRLTDADRLLARYAPDPLTGLPGRRAFKDLYGRLAAGTRRRGSGVILLLIDTEISQCDVITRRVNEKLAELTRQRGLHGVIHYDVSIAVNDSAPEDLDTLMRLADEEMQKRKGRKAAGQSG